jgi:hypothetical protein
MSKRSAPIIKESNMDYTTKAFLEGYELGRRAAKQCLGDTKRVSKINVEEEPACCKPTYEMERINGKLVNIGGRTIPF